MRKALPLTGAFILALALLANVYGDDVPAKNTPKFDYVPDFILGDSNGAQSTSNYYYYDQANFSQYILDENGPSSTVLKIGFGQTDAHRGNFSIDGKSRMTVNQVAAWERSAAVPDAKNIGASAPLVMRATSDLDNLSVGGSIAQYQGLHGPHWGFGRTNDAQSLIQLYGADNISNTTDTTSFWVRLQSGVASSLTGGPVLPTQNIQDMASASFVFFTLDTAGAFVNGFKFGPVVSGYDGFDGLIADTRNIPGDTIGWGAWENTAFMFGDPASKFGNSLLCASWTLSSDAATSALVPGLRTRMRPVIPQPDPFNLDPNIAEYQKRVASTEYRYDPTVQDFPNTARMANMNQIAFNHYFVHPNVSSVTDSSPTLWVSLDIIDMPDIGNRAPAAAIFVDRLIFTVRPKPGEGGLDAYAAIYDKVGAAVATPLTNWFSATFALDTPSQQLGAYVVSAQTDGLRFRSNLATFAEQRLFSIAQQNALGIDLRNYQGDLMRVRTTMKTDASIMATTQGKADMRVRFYAAYAEPSILLNIPQYWDNPTTDLSTLVIPSPSGTDYELYMDVPVPAAPIPGSDPTGAVRNQMVFAWDAIDYYHPTMPGAYHNKQALFVTMTRLRVDTIAKF